MKRGAIAAMALGWSSVALAQTAMADYPPAALREHRQGTTEMLVAIDKEGWPQGCQVTRSSGSRDLDEAACQTIRRRGHWSPATNDRGEPVATSTPMKIRWVLPR